MTARSLAAVVVAFLVASVSCSDDSADTNRTPAAGGTILVSEAALSKIHLPVTATDDLKPSQRLAAADFDGDGREDLAVGVPGADGSDGARPDSGQVFVIPGADLPGDYEIEERAAFLVHGAIAGDNLGFAVTAGDLNADGVSDLIAGAIGSNSLDNLRTDMGEVFVFFGGSRFSGERDLAAGDYDMVLRPAEGFSQLGAALATGDINDDGIADLVAGAPYAGREPGSPVGGARTTVGEVYVIYGGEGIGGTVEVANGEENVLISGGGAFEQFGNAVAVDDINGDGTSDIIIGAPGFDPSPARRDAGAVFVFRGRTDLGKRLGAGAADLTLHGSVAGGRFGDGVAIVNGLVIAAAPTEGISDRPACGVAYVFDLSSGQGAPLTSYAGAEAGEFMPASVSEAPAAEAGLLLGSPLADEMAGVLYLVDPYGSTGLVDLSSNTSGSTKFVGAGSERLGYALASIDIGGEPEVAALAAGRQSGSGGGPATVYLFTGGP